MEMAEDVEINKKRERDGAPFFSFKPKLTFWQPEAGPAS